MNERPIRQQASRTQIKKRNYTVAHLSTAAFLKVCLASKLLVLDNLNPVTIGVQQKRDVLHPSICQSLLPANLEILEPLAGGIQVINRDT